MVYGVLAEVLIWLLFAGIGYLLGYARCYVNIREKLLTNFRSIRPGRNTHWVRGYYKAYTDTAPSWGRKVKR